MAIVSMLGFDNMTSQAGLVIADPYFPVSIPRLMKSPINANTISLAQALGSAYTHLCYRNDKDPDGNASIGVFPYTLTSQSAATATQQLLIGPPVTDTTLDKTGKWVFGVSVYVPAVIASTGALAIIGDVADRTKNIAIAQGGTVVAPTLQISGGVAYYIEFVIDWVNKTVEGWVDGVFIASTTFTTTPIAFVGNAGTDTTYLPSSGSQTWWSASYSLFTSTGYHPSYNHIYFGINKANETDVTPRLGPVRVRNVAVSSVDVAGDSAPVGATDALTAVNTNVILGSIPSVNLRLDTAGGKNTFHFTTPVIQSNEETITAFQMDVYTFKQRDSAANAVLSFTDGSTVKGDYTLPETEAVRRESLCLSQPLAGGSWSPTAVAAMLVKLNSIPNS